MTDTHRGEGKPAASATPSDSTPSDSTAPAPQDGDMPVPPPPHAPARGAHRADDAPRPEAPAAAAARAADLPDTPTGPGWPPVGGRTDARPPTPPAGEGTGSGALRLLGVAALTALLTYMAGWGVLAMIGGVVVMIFLHELGHYLTAKWAGMKVTEFFIGFGPRVWSFRRGETEYGLKVIPAGAYVRIIGMNNLDEADPADEARTYRQQSFPKRLLVVSAGSIMHFIQAFVLLVVALGVLGVPGGSVVDPDRDDARAWAVTNVTADSAADEAGLRDGDEIVAVDGTPINELGGDLSDVVTSYDVGDDVTFTVDRDGESRTVEATLRARPENVAGGRAGTPFLGVGSATLLEDEPIGLLSAIVATPGEMVRFTGESLGALAGLFSPDGIGDFAENVNNASEDADRDAGGTTAAPREGEDNRLVSIYGVVRLGAELGEQGGIVMFLLLFFQINVFIGIFNMVPLPPLDGGHAAVAIYERIRSRRGLRYHADIARLMPLTYAVVMVIVLLGVTSLYLDIVNPVDL